jgi:hypothetical protein
MNIFSRILQLFLQEEDLTSTANKQNNLKRTLQ